MHDQRFPKQLRLRTPADFERVFQSRTHAADAVLVVNGCLNDRDQPRLGLSISRKVGHAPLRNRWKRLIREAFRQLRPQLPSGIDYVIRPRRGAQPDFHRIRESLPRLADQIERRLHRDRR